MEQLPEDDELSQLKSTLKLLIDKHFGFRYLYGCFGLFILSTIYK